MPESGVNGVTNDTDVANGDKDKDDIGDIDDTNDGANDGLDTNDIGDIDDTDTINDVTNVADIINKISELLLNDPTLSQAQLAEVLQMSKRNISRTRKNAGSRYSGTCRQPPYGEMDRQEKIRLPEFITS